MNANSMARPIGGLFEQLAAQQLASTPLPQGLRPQLPYPFEDLPFRAGGEMDLDAPTAHHVTARAAQDPARPVAQDAIRTIDAQSSLVSASPAAPNRAGEIDASPPLPGMSSVTIAPIRPVTPLPKHRYEPDLPQPLASSVVERSESFTDQPRMHERIIQVETAVARPASEPQSADTPNSLTPPVYKPSGLLPRLPHPAPVLPPMQPRQAPEPTIEIHIGRVEVRAQVAPTPPAPVQRPAPQDQRLATYLRHRGNGARS
ncbi:hypothetical protein [Pseudomonas sp. R5(2019)]|uniref:hypothetical protein n=1 Tax=Pseudomonas sp. R5(2019) TaxID=2697566 RepID=UPI0014128E44|nr:hypothetical protein [Pseudomonas sp. R5(2019)]